MTEDKTIKSSKGRCMCQSPEQMRQCAKYTPVNMGWHQEICAWLYKWDGISCLYTSKADKFMWLKMNQQVH